MRRDILPGDIGTEFLIPILRAIEDEADFSALSFIAVFLRAQKHSQLQWHVEARQLRFRIKFGAGDIVNADATLGDDLENLIHTHLTGVGEFEGAARNVAAVVDGENDRVKQLPVERVEWAVDEYAVVVFAAH